MASANNTEQKLSVKDMALIAVMTAVTCILSPLTLPIGPVPISLQILILLFSIYLLGTVKALVSYILYLLIGFIGVPVFSGFTSGPAKLLGPTGGYLIGFIPLILITGTIISRSKENKLIDFIGMLIGTAVCYAFGTVWLAYEAHMTASAALAAGVIPFIPADLIKMVIALVLGPQIRRRLIKAGLI